jgi:PPOX class probable F420-dependent enzyme
MTITMGSSEREAFLAGLHVAVLCVEDPSRGPLSVPVWYAYEAGGTVDFITGRDSSKARRLRAAGRCSMCVQTEVPPYAYISIEGPVSCVQDPVNPDAHRALAYRYLGPEYGELYLAATAGDAPDSVLFSVTPERWRTADFAKQLG